MATATSTVTYTINSLETHMGKTWRITAMRPGGGAGEEIQMDVFSDAFDPPLQVGNQFQLYTGNTLMEQAQYVAKATKVDVVDGMQVLSMSGLMMRLPVYDTAQYDQECYVGLQFM